VQPRRSAGLNFNDEARLRVAFPTQRDNGGSCCPVGAERNLRYVREKLNLAWKMFQLTLVTADAKTPGAVVIDGDSGGGAPSDGLATRILQQTDQVIRLALQTGFLNKEREARNGDRYGNRQQYQGDHQLDQGESMHVATA